MKDFFTGIEGKPFHFVLLLIGGGLIYYGETNTKDAMIWSGGVFVLLSIAIFFIERVKAFQRSDIEKLLNRPASQLLDETVQVPIYIIDSDFKKILYMNSRALEFYNIPDGTKVSTYTVQDLISRTRHLYGEDTDSFERDQKATLGFIAAMQRETPRCSKIPPKFFVRQTNGQDTAIITQISSFAIDAEKPKYLVEVSEILASAIVNKDALIAFLQHARTLPQSGILPSPHATS